MRQIQQTLEWNTIEFRVQRTERLGRMVAKWREGREAPSSKHPFSNRLRGSLRSGDTDGTHANEKGGAE